MRSPVAQEGQTWQEELATALRVAASELTAEARRLRALALKLECPPTGVRVEYAGRNMVRFIGPAMLDATATATAPSGRYQAPGPAVEPREAAARSQQDKPQ